jgi:hypothetical protein
MRLNTCNRQIWLAVIKTQEEGVWSGRIGKIGRCNIIKNMTYKLLTILNCPEIICRMEQDVHHPKVIYFTMT